MKFQPHFDPDFLPMIEFERRYLEKSEQDCVLALRRNAQQVAYVHTRVSLKPELESETLAYLNRLIKSMLWIYGGHELFITLPNSWTSKLEQIFSGPQQFDTQFIVEQIFQQKLQIIAVEASQLPSAAAEAVSMGRKTGGKRLGFDVGGSDKKIAALENGKVQFAKSIIWDPYPQTDLAWHRRELRELFTLGASKLGGTVEAIGGSAPGIIMESRVKVSSIFRGLSQLGQPSENTADVFKEVVNEIFGDIPFLLANDGDVTALAGSMLLGKNNLLGIAMGTSQAAGYTNAKGSIQTWFSELAFVPVDMGKKASQDEWSKDWGTGAEYFSQQAVIRLAGKAGIKIPDSLAKPEKLAFVQQKLGDGHQGAADIFRSIGCYLGYSLPWYHKFYKMENVLLLGRVLKGEGGRLIISEAKTILAAEFPELKLELFTLSDEEILHGQAMAAASLA